MTPIAVQAAQYVGSTTLRGLRTVGVNARFVGDAFGGFRDWTVWPRQTVIQMRRLGVDSLPIAAFIATFTGIVLALLASYSFTGAVPLYFVGTLVEKTVTLELAPVLTGLALAGRVGANIAAELGTMRVTEQIDALETLAYDPIAYLVVPRLLAALIMVPILTILANAIGVGTAFATAVVATDVSAAAFSEGLRLAFAPFQIVYSIIKATIFGGAIAFFCSYEGYNTTAGAEGVGRSTAQAVVITSVAILVLDALTALLLAPYLQA
jgi:phospholipid/cholesterol/gamma-HCH transport system permease protein